VIATTFEQVDSDKSEDLVNLIGKESVGIASCNYIGII
jgi:hypothetical protein